MAKLLTFDQALSEVLAVATANSVGDEEISLDRAAGRVLAREVVSSEALPPFTNSAMDGFLVHSDMLKAASEGAPIGLTVCGTIAAGDRELPPVCRERTCAFEIMTGAPVCEDYGDAVVRIEDARIERDAKGHARFIQIYSPVERAENVRSRGEDIAIGDVACQAGVVLSSAYLSALAAIGHARVQVRRLPRVALISTGSEVVDYTASHVPAGSIRNSSCVYLDLELRRLGIEPVDLGIVTDRHDEVECVLRRALERNIDLILCTGAVSVGRFDIIPEVLRRLGANIIFHGVSQRPGKPVLFGRLGEGTAFFGLPGNPVSTIVGYRFLVVPYLRTLLGLPRESVRNAVLSHDHVKKEGLRVFAAGKLCHGAPGLQVQVIPRQASFKLRPLLEANCWIIFDEPVRQVKQGSFVGCIPFEHSLFHSVCHGGG